MDGAHNGTNSLWFEQWKGRPSYSIIIRDNHSLHLRCSHQPKSLAQKVNVFMQFHGVYAVLAVVIATFLRRQPQS